MLRSVRNAIRSVLLRTGCLTSVSLDTGSAQQTTAVTINATLNGATQSRMVTVRWPFVHSRY